MNESKTDRFRRVAEARVNKIIKMIRLLGNCSGTGVYEYTDTQAAYIFSALQSELDKAKKRFRKPSLGKHRFSLTDTNEFDDDRPLEPTIALALPDGSYLRAVVYEDDHFPAINIYWDHDGGKASELLCFAEYNSERDEGAQVCIGTYVSDEDETQYYAPYMANAKIGEIQYVFINPGCGDNAETHTVREWLSEFGIPVEDEFFKLWHQKIFQLGSIFRKAEKVCSDQTMEFAWTATFVELYLEYDTSKDFLPQFEENSEKILNLMKMMPTSKDGVNHA